MLYPKVLVSSIFTLFLMSYSQLVKFFTKFTKILLIVLFNLLRLYLQILNFAQHQTQLLLIIWMLREQNLTDSWLLGSHWHFKVQISTKTLPWQSRAAKHRLLLFTLKVWCLLAHWKIRLSLRGWAVVAYHQMRKNRL